MPKVSVLIPCYNAAETLEETLQSIALQTYTNFEVVLVDDGSEDGTAGIINRWEGEHEHIKALMTEHSGIIPTLNEGLQHCAGEYVARMDADDLMHPERLAKQAAYLDQHPETALVCTDVRGFPEDELREGFRLYIEWLNSLQNFEDIQREMFVESPICHPSVMFRKEAVLRVGGYQEHGWAEDYDLWLRMIQAGMKIGKINEVLVDWRDTPVRLTRVDSRYSLQNFLRAKAHYLVRGPLLGRDEVIVWGSGMHGRRIGKLLLKGGAPVKVFVDIDPKKIGNTRQGLPIISREDLPKLWGEMKNPIVLSAVGSRGARELIREFLNEAGFVEGQDYLCVM